MKLLESSHIRLVGMLQLVSTLGFEYMHTTIDRVALFNVFCSGFTSRSSIAINTSCRLISGSCIGSCVGCCICGCVGCIGGSGIIGGGRAVDVHRFGLVAIRDGTGVCVCGRASVLCFLLACVSFRCYIYCTHVGGEVRSVAEFIYVPSRFWFEKVYKRRICFGLCLIFFVEKLTSPRV